jgi:hypothetical protein
MFFPMKEVSIGLPNIYLGAKMSKVTLANVVKAGAKSPSKYVQEAIYNLEEYLKCKHNGWTLAKKANMPFQTGHQS